MFLTNFKRIIRSALVNLWRSRVVSLSAILVVSITLFVFGAIIFSSTALDSALTQIKNKVDINVYFTINASEEDILSLKNSLEKLPEVGSIEYVSREQALLNFRERHNNDQLTLQALDELEENPLGAILNIQAKETSQYEGIVSFLDNDSAISVGGTSIIDKINYYQNKIVFDRLTKIIDSTERVGVVVSILLIIISIIITFNTIRLTIYISREEISVMRLVGASNRYVRGPFVIEGVFYGVISAAITLVAFFPINYYLADFSQRLFGMNMFDYYLSNFWNIFLIISLSGIFLGVISSYMAVRKYLKV